MVNNDIEYIKKQERRIFIEKLIALIPLGSYPYDELIISKKDIFKLINEIEDAPL